MSAKPTLPSPIKETATLQEIRVAASPAADGAARPPRRLRSTRLAIRVFGLGKLTFIREENDVG